MDMIKLIDLTKTYKTIMAVDHIHLEVERGAIFGFLGPNGAGKTTTIKMMAGILKPTSGQILIDGKSLLEDPSGVKKCIGFIPDRPFLYEKLSGQEFLQFIAGLYGMDHQNSTVRRIAELLDLFGLSLWQEELIEGYSHGMKQRLVMCAALLHQPKVLIVDEPMVGLDPRAARLAKDLFREEGRRGTTVFMSTHSLEIAQEVCDEVAIIHAGKIIAQGAPSDLILRTGAGGSLEHVFLKLTEERIARENPLCSR